MKSIKEIFGKDVHHHVFCHYGDKDKASVCHIEDLIPLYEEEIKVMQEKIKLLNEFKGTNVCIPLDDYRSYYITNMRVLDEWFNKTIDYSIRWCKDSINKGYKLIPCHPIDKSVEDYKNQYNISDKQKNKIQELIKYAKNFFKENIKNV